MDAKAALELYIETKNYWSANYQNFRDDVRFSIGLDHYHKKSPDQCRDEGLLVVPVLPQFIHQVCNDMRMNTPSISVLPSEDGQSDLETAKIFKGLIKSIEYKSNADDAYDTASEYAVRGGFGFVIVDHDYIAEDSFLQELKIRRVTNPLSVFLDPSYTECDGSDAEYGFILEPIKKKAFEERFPGKKFVSFGDNPTEDDKLEEINIAQLFIKKYTEITKQMSPTGEMEDWVEENEEKEKKKTKRKLRKVTIERYRFSGAEELEKTTFPGIYIPIIPFHGEEVWDDGKRNLLSLIRQAKDAQRRINKWATKESQLLDMAPVSPVQAPVGAVDNFMTEWGNPDDVMVMRYEQYTEDGKPLNKPERLPPPQIPTGFVNAMQEATEHVKQAMGLYNASIGQRSNETSGVAIDARKVEGEVATFHFADNRNRSIRHVGIVCVCAIPEVYDTDRTIQTIGEEEEPRLVGINGAQLQEGQQQEYDLRKGKYDIRVATGASYTTKRQEAAALYGDLLTKNPQLMGVFGDLWAKNLDVAGSEALAARIKKTIPKELLADEEAAANGEAPVDPEKIQMGAMLEQMQAQIQQMTAELESKQTEDKVKLGELEVKRGELQVKQGDLRLKYIQAFKGDENGESKSEAAPLIEDDIPVLQAKLENAVVKRQSAEQDALLAEEQAAYEAQAEEERLAAKEQQELELKMAEMEQRDQQAALLIQTLNNMSAQIGQLTSHVSQPMTLIRDESGSVVGAK
jgi:hypothetical protein